MNGYVYIIEKENGAIKIGRSVNPEQRTNELQKIGGFKIQRHYISPKCSNYIKLETDMHNVFKEKRIIGEWFNISFEKAVNELKNQEFEPLKFETEEEKKAKNERMDKLMKKVGLLTEQPNTEIELNDEVSTIVNHVTSDLIESINDRFDEHDKKINTLRKKYIFNTSINIRNMLEKLVTPNEGICFDAIELMIADELEDSL